MLGNFFIDSQFNYAPLIWMFDREVLYLKIQTIHSKTMNIAYQSNKTYGELLELSETQYSSTTLKIFSYLNLQKLQ